MKQLIVSAVRESSYSLVDCVVQVSQLGNEFFNISFYPESDDYSKHISLDVSVFDFNSAVQTPNVVYGDKNYHLCLSSVTSKVSFLTSAIDEKGSENFSIDSDVFIPLISKAIKGGFLKIGEPKVRQIGLVAQGGVNRTHTTPINLVWNADMPQEIVASFLDAEWSASSVHGDVQDLINACDGKNAAIKPGVNFWFDGQCIVMRQLSGFQSVTVKMNAAHVKAFCKIVVNKKRVADKKYNERVDQVLIELLS